MVKLLEGRSALVTGGGQGVGQGIARSLAEAGANVAIAQRNAEQGEAEAEYLRNAHGVDAFFIQTDVTKSAEVEAMVEAAHERFGRLDILVNNAGASFPKRIENHSDGDMEGSFALNYYAVFWAMKAAFPIMKAQGYGRVVFTSSSAGLFVTPMVGGYGAAKAGVAGLMHVAAHEGAAHGILCNALMPNAASRMAMQAAEDWTKEQPEALRSLPAEIGNAMNVEFNTPLAVYLASEACTETRGLWSQCLGRAARVFVGTVPGWQAQRQSPPTVEEIAGHWEQIRNTDGPFYIPETPHAELGLVLSGGQGQG